MAGAHAIKARSESATAERVLRSQTVYTSLTGLLVYGLSAITGPLLARALGPAGRGDLAAVLVPSELVGWALLCGLPMAAMYYADEYPHRQLVVGAWAYAVAAGGIVVAIGWWLVPRYLHGHPDQTVTGL
jgi:O-antigen/teichoic acid export membrane protein